MNLSKNGIKKIVMILCFVILFYEILENIGNIVNIVNGIIGLIFPFIIGGAIAFVINVPMRQIEKHLFSKTKYAKLKKCRRGIALLLTIALFLGVISIAMVIIIPEISSTVKDVTEKVPDAIDLAIEKLENVSDKNPEIQKQIESVDWHETTTSIIEWLRNGVGNYVNAGVEFVGDIISGITTFVIGLVFAIYILVQKEKLSSQIKQILYSFLKKEVAESIIKMGKISNVTFSNFLSGQFLEACILGTMFFITMTILRLPYALMMGFLIALTALIPIVGAFLGCAVGALLILIDSPIKALIFVVMFLVLQQLEGNLIYPHVVGNSVGLPSIWVLVAVTLGANLMGIVGMLVFIPICSILYALFREVVKKRLKERHISEELYNNTRD